jgi:4-amino-4-deoxy-L-arabinose transferase-like glycosyltransferase
LTNSQSITAKKIFSTPHAIFFTGLLIRILYITFAHSYRFHPFEDHFTFGYEMARIARALVTGYGYADPFSGHTGPTAWVPPLYPLLIAAIFKLGGIYTAKSGWIILAINSVFSAATAIYVYEIAARCYNRKVAVWSAWIWALYPAAMQYAVRAVWETTLTTFLFTAMLALVLRMRDIRPYDRSAEKAAGPCGQVFVRRAEPDHESNAGVPANRSRFAGREWLLFGLFWGLIALSNSTLLLFLPVCGIWLLLDPRSKPAISKALLSGVVFVAIITPWTIRNYRAFHAFVPFRSNFGAELYVGNGPGAYGFRYGALIGQPAQDAQHRLYVRLGELAYTHQRGELAKAWIRAHPARFASLSLKRFYFFWASVPHPTIKHPFGDYLRQVDYCFASITGLLGVALSLKRRTPAAALFACAFALLPLTYYFITVEARFRHPLEPLIVILTVYLFQSATPRRVKESLHA